MIKNLAKGIIKSKIKIAIFTIIKPFIPYILIIILLFFAMCTLIDAIFIDQVQNNDSLKNEVELELKNSCIEKAEYLNTCDNYIGDTKTEYLLDIDSRETISQIEWSHLYSIMSFHNMAHNTHMNDKLLDSIANHFKSTFIYEETPIKIEETIIDDSENSNIITTEEKSYILVESNTIMGHYTYNYELQTIQKDNIKITTKIYTSENSIGEKYSRLKEYLKKELKVDEKVLDYDVQVIIQAANGYYEGKENLSWLQNSSFIGVDTSIIEKGIFTWPVPGYTQITSEFGMRIHPVTGAYKLHTGTDVSAPIGANFVAMADGIVINASYNSAYGNMVIIDHR